MLTVVNVREATKVAPVSFTNALHSALKPAWRSVMQKKKLVKFEGVCHSLQYFLRGVATTWIVFCLFAFAAASIILRELTGSFSFSLITLSVSDESTKVCCQIAM